MNDPEQKLRLAIDLAPHVPADRLPETCARIWEWANGGRVEIRVVEPEKSDDATIADDGPPRAVAENPFAKPAAKPKPPTPDQELLAKCRAEAETEEPAPLKPVARAEKPKPKRAVVRGGGGKNALLTPERRRDLFMDMARGVKSKGQLEDEYGLNESQIKSQRYTYGSLYHRCAQAVLLEKNTTDKAASTAPNQNDDLVDMPSFVATPKRLRFPANTPSMDGAIPARQSGGLTQDERAQIDKALVRRFEGGTFDDILRRTLETAGRDVDVRWVRHEYRWVIDRRAAGAEPLTPPPGPSGRKPLPTAMPSQSSLKAQARAAHAAKSGGGA